MTPEERSLLERTHKLAEDNNKILLSIRRSSRISTGFRIAYWIVILVLSFGAYYFIQPYVTTLLGAYDDVRGNLQGIQGNMNTAQNAASSLRDLLK